MEVSKKVLQQIPQVSIQWHIWCSNSCSRISCSPPLSFGKQLRNRYAGIQSVKVKCQVLMRDSINALCVKLRFKKGCFHPVLRGKIG